MVQTYRVPIAVTVVWATTVLLAVWCGSLSASAGILPDRWMGIGMVFGLVNVALVVVGAWYLPASIPRIIARLLQLAGMAGALWAAGTLTRAIYALTV
ncbi:hypothetical protein [Lacipirellula parvula]|uniref:Uncharacterized protein n=1 Tax=Lacipirellula parvula TaxID=2650471 RepID=A0A5K7XF10_9BACT|nr:hypothetical protein [Lacipirellula parvula]BBO31579.1 hypothetical protein PLANPX_1191 [Lacipirellula parvula]